MNKLSRQEAWELLTEYTETPALQKHAYEQTFPARGVGTAD